ncbi:MAG: winged helix-turn-helix transcriptional regulator [Clostridia bacterium]|nr:winged helix-turn-helix transcriptional regulator [Clostridia bacterium]
MSEIKTPTAREAMHCFIGAMRAHRRIFDEMRERTGLGRTSHRILMILSENPDGCSQTCLAEKLEISTAAVAVAIKKMVAEGYFAWTVCKSDSRLNTTLLTDKGKSLASKSHTVFSEIDNAVFDGFSDDEMRLFYEFALRITENVNDFETGKEMLYEKMA